MPPRSGECTRLEDDAATGQNRLPLRLWLAMPNSHALRDGHEVLWRNIEAGAMRGGIEQRATRLSYFVGR